MWYAAGVKSGDTNAAAVPRLTGLLAAGLMAGLALGAPFRAAAGLRVLSRKDLVAPAKSSKDAPPLGGPLARVALTTTDEGLPPDDLNPFATAHTGVSGTGAVPPTNVTAILDSGAATHLLSYPDSLLLQVVGEDFLTSNVFTVGGVAGTADVRLSMPMGFFSHGLQDLQAGAHQPGSMLGQGNFAAGVNTQSNHDSGKEIPTVLGAPFLAFYAAWIRQSEQVILDVQGGSITSPAVSFTGNAGTPGFPRFPDMAHRIFIEPRPLEAALLIQYVGTVDIGSLQTVPGTPSFIGSAGSLFFTASDMVFSEEGVEARGRMLVDSGAQATVLSEIAAAELDLDVLNPEFVVEVQGIGGTTNAPGFTIDRLRLPALGGALVWSNAPVLVLNVAAPGGGTTYGILGSNLFHDRDLVFNAIAGTPYIDLSGPLSKGRFGLSAPRDQGPDVLALDWFADPPRSRLVLQRTASLLDGEAGWSDMATGVWPRLEGSFSVTGVLDRQYFRLIVP